MRLPAHFSTRRLANVGVYQTMLLRGLLKHLKKPRLFAPLIRTDGLLHAKTDTSD